MTPYLRTHSSEHTKKGVNKRKNKRMTEKVGNKSSPFRPTVQNEKGCNYPDLLCQESRSSIDIKILSLAYIDGRFPFMKQYASTPRRPDLSKTISLHAADINYLNHRKGQAPENRYVESCSVAIRQDSIYTCKVIVGLQDESVAAQSRTSHCC